MNSNCLLFNFKMLNNLNEVLYHRLWRTRSIWELKSEHSDTMFFEKTFIVQTFIQPNDALDSKLLEDWDEFLRALTGILTAVGLWRWCTCNNAVRDYPTALQIAEFNEAIGTDPVKAHSNREAAQNISQSEWIICWSNASVTEWHKWGENCITKETHYLLNAESTCVVKITRNQTNSSRFWLWTAVNVENCVTSASAHHFPFEVNQVI